MFDFSFFIIWYTESETEQNYDDEAVVISEGERAQ